MSMVLKRTVYSPIVGNTFRLAGKSILPLMGEGHPLILEPEPENPYDPDAIKVCVDANTVTLSNGASVADGLHIIGKAFTAEEYHVPESLIVHLGYIPRSGAKTDTTGFGTIQVYNIIVEPNWEATLTFSPQGRPMVRINIYEGDH